jgi:hypothetical protein
MGGANDAFIGSTVVNINSKVITNIIRHGVAGIIPVVLLEPETTVVGPAVRSQHPL